MLSAAFLFTQMIGEHECYHPISSIPYQRPLVSYLFQQQYIHFHKYYYLFPLEILNVPQPNDRFQIHLI